jgi:hypothetical protein
MVEIAPGFFALVSCHTDAIHELVHISILALILCQEEICDSIDKVRKYAVIFTAMRIVISLKSLLGICFML